MTDPTRALLGEGFAYPGGVDEATGGVLSAAGVASVRASLFRLFETAPGEEFFLPEYGCQLKYLVFEEDTEVLRALAEVVVREAVRRWEPRVQDVISIVVEPVSDAAPHVLQLRVAFRLINSQSTENLVYPLTLSV